MNPIDASKSKRGRRPRGSALVLAIVTVLILTIVAVGLAYFSTTEDRISGNDKLQKEGFYAAEAGLRAGENLLSGGALANEPAATALLSQVISAGSPDASPKDLDLGDGGYKAIVLKVGGMEYRDQPVTFGTGNTADKPYYTLYVRNDTEDRGTGKGDDKTDTNKKVNLISVGYVKLDGGKRITKIIEEQVSAVDTGTGSGYEKGANEGGTNG